MEGIAPDTVGPVDGITLVGENHTVKKGIPSFEGRVKDIAHEATDDGLHVGVSFGDGFRYVTLEP